MATKRHQVEENSDEDIIKINGNSHKKRKPTIDSDDEDAELEYVLSCSHCDWI